MKWMKTATIMFIFLLMILLSIKLSLAQDYIIGDGKCEESLDEDRFISPDDCKPTTDNYIDCMMSKEDCLDDGMFVELHVLLIGVVIVLFLLRYQVRSTPGILRKKPKKKKFFSFGSKSSESSMFGGKR